jgi:hypothetical protein
MLLEHKLKKNHYKKRHLLNIFLKSKKNHSRFAKCIMQTEQAKYTQHEQTIVSQIGFKTEPVAIMKAESIRGPE